MEREVKAKLDVERTGDRSAFADLAADIESAASGFDELVSVQERASSGLEATRSEVAAVRQELEELDGVLDRLVDGFRERFASLSGFSGPLLAELEGVLQKARETAAGIDELAG